MSKRNYKKRHGAQRNLNHDKNRGIDFWAAGIADPDSTYNTIIARILIQRLKHAVKSKRQQWLRHVALIQNATIAFFY